MTPPVRLGGFGGGIPVPIHSATSDLRQYSSLDDLRTRCGKAAACERSHFALSFGWDLSAKGPRRFIACGAMVLSTPARHAGFW